MIDKLEQAVFDKGARQMRREHTLTYLFWECTLKCNLHCLHCGSDCTQDSKVPDMPLQDFVKVLDDIKEKNPYKKMTIAVTGGEPLLRQDLEDAGQEITKRGFQWGIVTNGLLMTEKRWNSLITKGNLASISYSIDGLAAEHAYLRQNEKSFDKVVDSIKRTVKYKEQHPWFGFDVITCVHKGNLNKLPELRDFLISLGVKDWRVFSIFPNGRAQQNNLGLTNQEYQKMMNFIMETKQYKTPEGKSINCNYSCEGYLGPYEMKARDYHFFCRGGINVGSVMCDGNITACLSVRAPDFIQGNIYKDSFMDVWNNKFLDARHREKWAKVGKCKHCKEWKHCLGNGLHLHHDNHSEPEICNYHMLIDKAN